MLFILSTFYEFHFGNFLFSLRRWTADEHDALDWLNMLTESGRITTCYLYLTASIALTSVVFFAELNVIHMSNCLIQLDVERQSTWVVNLAVLVWRLLLCFGFWSMQHIDMI